VTDAEREDPRRRARFVIGLSVSVALHLFLWLSLTLRPSNPHSVAAMRAAVGVVVDVAVPGLGEPGAPVGEARHEESDEDVAAVAAPAPRARVRQGIAPFASREPSPEPAIESATDGRGSSDDAFIDGLMARATGRGDGAGGRGGAGCPDAVAGTWRAQRYSRERGRWGVFTLRVERDHDEALSGTITLHSWTGGPADDRPPRCAPGVFEHVVRMNATGRLVGRDFRFEGRDHRRTIRCMSEERWAYNLDSFTGTLAANRIVSVNNDGGWEVNTPYTFRRVACE
jgi:hypothetical protein